MFYKKKPPSMLSGLVAAMSASQVKHRMGKGMSLSTEAAWMLYVLNNLARRGEFSLAEEPGVAWENDTDDDEVC